VQDRLDAAHESEEGLRYGGGERLVPRHETVPLREVSQGPRPHQGVGEDQEPRSHRHRSVRRDEEQRTGPHRTSEKIRKARCSNGNTIIINDDDDDDGRNVTE